MKRLRNMMKQVLIAATLLATTHSYAQTPKAIDIADSKLLWTASKLTGDHTGRVVVKGGSITVGEKALLGAEVVMDMAAITCMDIEDQGTNAKFVKHLKSEDFFDVENHPTATFTATKVESIVDAAPGRPNYKVTGDLTIKGITKSNTFDCIFWMDGDKARAAAMLSFDRAQYDIKYRSGTFFPELGDKVIADKVDLTFDVTAR